MADRFHHNVHLLPTLVIPTVPKVASSSIGQALMNVAPAQKVEDLDPDQVHGREIVNLLRDPMDRLLSLYTWRRETWWGGWSFDQFVEWVCNKPDEESDRHFRSQSGLLTSPSGVCLVGRVFRYEDIDKFWAYVQVRANVCNLPHQNPSGLKRRSYPRHCKQKVFDRYATDYALLDSAVI